MKQICKIIFLSILVGFMYPVFASDTPQGAIDNCADKDEGDACDFMNSEGVTLDGFCIAQSDNKGYLACVPSE